MRKLIHRHPHVFGATEVAGSDEVLRNWEKLKAEEAGGRGEVDEDIPASLPSLARAAKVQRRAAGWGFEWRSVDSALSALREEVDELAAATGEVGAREDAPEGDVEGEIGDVLFATVARRAEARRRRRVALRRTIRVFAARYERFVDLAEGAGIDVETRPRRRAAGAVPRGARTACRDRLVTGTDELTSHRIVPSPRSKTSRARGACRYPARHGAVSRRLPAALGQQLPPRRGRARHDVATQVAAECDRLFEGFTHREVDRRGRAPWGGAAPWASASSAGGRPPPDDGAAPAAGSPRSMSSGGRGRRSTTSSRSPRRSICRPSRHDRRTESLDSLDGVPPGPARAGGRALLRRTGRRRGGGACELYLLGGGGPDRGRQHARALPRPGTGRRRRVPRGARAVGRRRRPRLPDRRRQRLAEGALREARLRLRRDRSGSSRTGRPTDRDASRRASTAGLGPGPVGSTACP